MTTVTKSATKPVALVRAKPKDPVARADEHALRVLPSVPDDEREVIGRVLRDPRLTSYALSTGVQAIDFGVVAHERIFSAVEAVHARGRGVDLDGIIHELRERDHLNAIGDGVSEGLVYLEDLITAASPIGDVATFAKKVHATGKARRAITLADTLAAEVYLDPSRAPELAAQYSERVVALNAPATKASSVPKIEIFRAGDIFAPLPPPVYVVDGLIEAASLTLVGGYGASAKTWLAMDMGLAVSLGAAWQGAHATRRGSYLHLDYEQGRRESSRRVQALYKGNGYEGEPAIELAPFPALYAADEDFESRMHALAVGRSLVSIDSLAVLSAGIDENTSIMRASLDVLRRVGERTGCAFVVVLHAKKTSQSATDIDPRELFRGSSSIFDAADQALAVVKAGDRFVVAQTKARHGKAVEPFAFRLVDINGGVQLTPSSLEPEPEAQVDPFQAASDAILDFVRRNAGCSSQRAIDFAKGKTSTKRAALDELIEQGRIVATPGPKNAIQLRVEVIS